MTGRKIACLSPSSAGAAPQRPSLPESGLIERGMAPRSRGERDAAIRERFASGDSLALIGDDYHLSRQRVGQICEGIERKPGLDIRSLNLSGRSGHIHMVPLIPHADSSPLTLAIYRNGKKRCLEKETIRIGDQSYELSSTNLACLAALAREIDYPYAIAKAYDASHTTIHGSLLVLQAEFRLIEPKIADGEARYEANPAPYLPRRARFQLTDAGESVVKELKRSSAFFAQCESWLGKICEKPLSWVETIRR